MREVLDSLFVIAMALIIGLALGGVITTTFWLENVKSDCVILGKFRYQSVVYVCSRANGGEKQ